jgi:hypothetical protein
MVMIVVVMLVVLMLVTMVTPALSASVAAASFMIRANPNKSQFVSSPTSKFQQG